MVSEKEIKHIADLAELDLEENKEKDLVEDVTSILDYMEIIQELDVKGVEPMGHIHKNENILREDKAQPALRETKKEIMENVPSKKDNYFKVNTILNKNDEA